MTSTSFEVEGVWEWAMGNKAWGLVVGGLQSLKSRKARVGSLKSQRRISAKTMKGHE
jgi:hypothetical protein